MLQNGELLLRIQLLSCERCKSRNHVSFVRLFLLIRCYILITPFTYSFSYFRFRFPDAVKDKERRQKWIDAIKRKDFKPKTYSRLCSLHFTENDYDPPVISGPLRLKKNAVPSVFDFPIHFVSKRVPERRRLIRSTPEQVRAEKVSSPLLYLYLRSRR